MRIEDTENRLSQPGWFVLEDINRRTEAAYERHQALFDDPAHQSRVSDVEQILRTHAKSWNTIYQNARASTKRRSAHTEVKLSQVLFAPGARVRAGKALEAMGIASEDIVYKPASQSISVHVK